MEVLPMGCLHALAGVVLPRESLRRDRLGGLTLHACDSIGFCLHTLLFQQWKPLVCLDDIVCLFVCL